MVMMAVMILYTFIMALLGTGIEYYFVVKIILTIAMLIFETVMVVILMPHFGTKWVIQGNKHRNELMNAVAVYIFPTIIAVFLYSIGTLDQLMNVIYLFGGVISLYIIPSYFLDYVVVTEESIIGSYIIQPKRVEIPFAEITKIEFSNRLNSLVILSETKKIYLDITLTDVKAVINVLTEKLDKEVIEEAFKKMGEYFKLMRVYSNILELNFFKVEQHK